MLDSFIGILTEGSHTLPQSKMAASITIILKKRKVTFPKTPTSSEPGTHMGMNRAKIRTTSTLAKLTKSTVTITAGSCGWKSPRDGGISMFQVTNTL